MNNIELDKLDVEAGVAEARRLAQAALNDSPTGIGEMTAHLAQSTGKGLRSQLLVRAAMDEAGLAPYAASRAAAAVELLHMATLAHDDVIDEADTRRGRATINKKFGNRNAIICGDYLLSLSLSMLAEIEFENGDNPVFRSSMASRFAKAISFICQGEYGQHLNNGNVDLSVFSYLRVISGKTAALFYVSALMGAVLGGENETTAFALGNFGQRLGIAFQIADDCKDYEMDEATAQKPVGYDLRSGIVTLPLILAMRKNPCLREYAQAVIRNEKDAAALLAETRAVRGPQMAREVAGRFEEKAARVLAVAHERKRKSLLALLREALPAISPPTQ